MVSPIRRSGILPQHDGTEEISVVRRVSLELQRRILEGEIDTGKPLPPERSLASEFGTSRTSIREAIAALAASGLVSVQHGRGVFVRQRGVDGSHDPQRAWQYDGQLSLRDVYQMRLLVEPYSVGMLTLVVTPQIALKLEDNIASMERAFRDEDFVEATKIDFAFHWMFVEPLGNRIFCDLLSRSASILPQGADRPFEESVPEHRSIIEHVVKGDAEGAMMAMQRHIVNAARRARITLRPMTDLS